jgi:hypothetical protein
MYFNSLKISWVKMVGMGYNGISKSLEGWNFGNYNTLTWQWWLSKVGIS